MDTYDHIVIGAGSAGCAVAARLSEDPSANVLLIEAGGTNKRLEVKAPAAFANQFGTKLDWEYWTEPEENLLGRKLHEPRGKMLGGCSSMNAMLYIRGNRIDYDGWVEQGAEGWTWDECLPYFKKSEDNADFGDPHHGKGGELHVERLAGPDPMTVRMCEAAYEVGFERNDDVNDGGSQLGGGVAQVTHKKGLRLDCATAFLAPARKRKNLTIMTKALVHRVIVRGGRAIGVELSRGSRLQQVFATQEVVLSAGAFGTPEILQRSGIGDPQHLRSVGIEPLVDLPAVGQHLQEHPLQLLHWELEGGEIGLMDAADPKHLAKWLATRKGKLASNVAEAVIFFKTDASMPAPNMEFHLAPAFFHEHGKREHPRPAMSIAISHVAPRSRGSVLVRSADPTQKAAVRLNMYSQASEMAEMVQAVHLAREVISASGLDPYRGLEINPGPYVRTDDQIAEYVRATVEHTYHPTSTARIGSPQDGVLDPQLRVHGVEGLRVADASVMPSITRGNTHAPTIMIGERCADFIRTGGRGAAEPALAGAAA
jgi:choline dehydrogenase